VLRWNIIEEACYLNSAEIGWRAVSIIKICLYSNDYTRRGDTVCGVLNEQGFISCSALTALKELVYAN